MRQENNKGDISVIWICLIVSLIIITAVVGSIYMMQQDTQSGSGYDLIKDERSYQLDLKSWTGTDENRMLLKSGDMLHIEWNLQAGVIDISIVMSEHKPIYTANRVDCKDNPEVSFDVMIPESGDYVFRISAKEATGTIGIIKP